MNRLAPVVLALLAFAVPARAAWHESLSEALAQAKEKKAHVLVDFEAPWCYSCYYMQQKVLSQPRFIEAARDLVLVKLDVDKEEGHALKAKHAVTFLPSYLLLDAEGKEVGRIVGEQTEDDFLAKLSAARAARKASAEREARLASLRAQLAQGDSDALVSLLQEPPTCELAYDVMKGEKTLEKAEKDRARRIRELEKAKLRELARERLLVPEKARCADFRSGVEALADVYEKLGEKQARDKLLDDALAQLMPRRAPGEDRNRDDNVRYFLELKKDDAGLRKWYARLIKAYPSDYVYSYRFAKYLQASGKSKEALAWIERADKLAYGANRLQVTLVRAKILSDLGRAEEGRKLAERDLKAASGKFAAVEKPLSDWLAAQK